MLVSRESGWSPAPTAAGAVVGLAGFGLVGVGLWGRRDVRRALERERIVSTPDATPAETLVATARGARSMAEVIRSATAEATGGRTYAETCPYVDEDGRPTSDADRAATDGRTGARLENPEHALWAQSVALQGALMQAYLAFRVAELALGLGAVLVTAGAGLLALGRRPGRS